jgi:hypothetical protein
MAVLITQIMDARNLRNLRNQRTFLTLNPDAMLSTIVEVCCRP